MCVGDRIRELRKAKGMTQGELAKKLGLKDSAIAKYENGRVENIKRSVLSEMAKILDCSPVYLLGIDSMDFVISEDEKQIVIEYRNMDDENKKMFSRMLKYASVMKNNKNSPDDPLN